MVLALLSDIHGNLPALEAVLEDLQRLGVEDVLCLGDMVGLGPQPDEVVGLLRKRAIPCLLGNHEEAVLERAPAGAPPAVLAAAQWAQGTLSPSNLEWLRRLPRERRVVLHHRGLLLTHASPGSLWEGISPEAEAASLRDTLVAGRCDVLVVGHTHTRFVRDAGRGIVANPGSVGLSFDGPEASYLLVDRAGAFQGEPRGKGLDFAERDVAYDVQRFADETLKAQGSLEHLPERARQWLPRRR